MKNYTKSGLISIIITLYNKADYIEETIFSIYKQTYTNRELIIVDDCSTDGSLEIAKNFCNKLGISNKCKFIENEKNLWVAKTFEKGLKESKGDRISMCDGDDILMKNKLEENLKYCVNHNMDFCCSDCVEINENNNCLKIYKKSFFMSIFLKNAGSKDRIMLDESIGTSVFFNNNVKEILIKDGFPPDVPQDNRAMECAGLHNCKIGRINVPLFYYRRCERCISINFEKNIIRAYEEMIKRRFFSTRFIIKNIKLDKPMMNRILRLNKFDEILFAYIKSDEIVSLKLILALFKSKLGIKYWFVQFHEIYACFLGKLKNTHKQNKGIN